MPPSSLTRKMKRRVAALNSYSPFAKAFLLSGFASERSIENVSYGVKNITSKVMHFPISSLCFTLEAKQSKDLYKCYRDKAYPHAERFAGF
jgi:hypothetical protein